jgi:pimeloyl-ACP methyl ester carboxylesterase
MSNRTEPQFHFHDLPHGIRLHAAHWGDPTKPLMLFLHGFPEFWYAWRNLAPMFADRYHCVAPDLRGFNLSSHPVEVSEYKAHKVLQDLLELTQLLGKKELILVSHDWGGAIGWAWTIAQSNPGMGLPSMVQRHISINSPHPATFARELAHNPEQQHASDYMLWLREPWAAEALSKDSFAKLQSFMLAMSPDASWFTPEVREQYVQCWSHGLQGGLNYYRATPLVPPTALQPNARAWQFNPQDLRTTVPTLVIWGMQDSALLPCLLHGLGEYVPSLAVRELASASHWVVHEQPALVEQHISQFLTS